MRHFISLLIPLWYYTILHTVNCTNPSPTLYISYHFNLNNLSEWSINEYSTETQQIVSCIVQIPSLCIQFRFPTTNQFNILYKDLSFNFLHQAEYNTNLLYNTTTIATNTETNSINIGKNNLIKRRTLLAMGQWQGPYRIKGVGSNRCLDIGSRNGNRLIIWDCHNGANQKWYINKRTREFRIGSRNGKCLDIHGSHYNHRRNGATLHAWSCHRGQNQKFRFSGRHIRAQGKMNGRCLDVWRGQKRRGAKVILWPCHHGTNQQWRLKYVGRRRRRRQRRSRCPNILYQRRGRIRPRKNNRIKRINIEDNMIISLDISVNAFPRASWGNIIHCGSRDTIRQPGIWIHRHTKRFHIVYGTRRNWNQLKNSDFTITLRKKYKIEYKIRRNRYDIYINGRRFYSVRGRHHNLRNQPCYLSDPWYEAANVYVSNLKIIRGTDPRGGCPRRKPKRRRRKRRRRRRGVRPEDRRMYGKFYKIGKKIGKILRKDKDRRCGKNKCGKGGTGMPMGMNIGPVFPMGGPMEGWIVAAGPIETEKTEKTTQKRRLITDMDMRLKKCMVIKEGNGMNEICMVYYYMDGRIGLEYNVMVNGDVDRYDGSNDVYVEEYVMRINGMECNDRLVDVLGYIICVEKDIDGDNGLYVVLKDINGMLQLTEIDLRNDNGWDKIYELNDMINLKCKYIETFEICVDIISDNEMDIIAKKVIDYDGLEKINTKIVDNQRNV